MATTKTEILPVTNIPVTLLDFRAFLSNWYLVWSQKSLAIILQESLLWGTQGYLFHFSKDWVQENRGNSCIQPFGRFEGVYKPLRDHLSLRFFPPQRGIIQKFFVNLEFFFSGFMVGISRFWRKNPKLPSVFLAVGSCHFYGSINWEEVQNVIFVFLANFPRFLVPLRISWVISFKPLWEWTKWAT